MYIFIYKTLWAFYLSFLDNYGTSLHNNRSVTCVFLVEICAVVLGVLEGCRGRGYATMFRVEFSVFGGVGCLT